MLIRGEAGLAVTEAAPGPDLSLETLLMLASLRVEDSVLEFDLRLPELSQLSRVEDTERPLCSVFLEIGGLGGWATVLGWILTGAGVEDGGS